MSRLAPSLVSWARQNFSWSNTPQAWQERFGILFALAAILIGMTYVRDFDASLQVLFWLFALTATAFLFRRGWLRLFGPVLFYELTCLARRRRYFLTRFLFALFLLLVVCWGWLIWSVTWPMRGTSPSDLASIANSIFEMFVTIQFILVTVLTPVYTASAIADEKERRTLEFLLATDLRNREIVLSKLCARFLNVGMLVLAGLPILALLQFLGGVDPDLVLASYAATLATVGSLACLGTLFSVVVRRGRDAILLTYLAVVAYLVGYGLVSAMPAEWLAFPSTDAWTSPVTVEDVVSWYNAGNILDVIFNRLGFGRFRATGSVTDLLPEALRSYLIFHGVLALVCAVWAVTRLRAIALKEGIVRAQRKAFGFRWMRRPAVGEHPMVWKEVFVDPGLHLHWLGRIFLIVLVLASFVPLIFILDSYLSEPWFRVSSGMLAQSINIWARIVGTMVACLLLLGVAVRAAGSLGIERDRQTLDSLLTSPLDGKSILFGKWLGAVLGVRWGWLWLGAIYGLAMLTGAVHPVGLFLIILGWFVYAGWVAILGLWFSATCRTTFRSMVWTLITVLFAYGGHLLIWTCCCFPLLMATIDPGLSGEQLKHVAYFQVFALSPPASLGTFAFGLGDLDRSWDHEEEEFFLFALLGLAIWGAFTILLWGVTYSRLQQVTLRTGLRPERMRPPGPRTAIPARQAEEIPTVEEVQDEQK